MRILLSGLGRDAYPTGICRVAANHARALVSGRVAEQVILAIGSWQRELYTTLLGPCADIELVSVDIKNNSLSRNHWFAAELPRLATRFGASLVHYSFPAPVLRRRFPCPVVVTLHDLYPYDMPGNFGFPNYFANRIILRQCLRNVDGVACVSSSTRSRFEELFPNAARRTAIGVTGNYVRVSNVAQLAPRTSQELERSRFILCVAQHRKNKNLELLLHGYAKLLKSRSFQFPLVIVGAQGPETVSLMQLSESLGLSEKVEFLYSIGDAELNWLYRHCALLVICSSAEGFCLPLVEGLLTHAKVVCSDLGILRDVGGEQCAYFSLGANAAENLADAITESLARPLRTTTLDGRFSEEKVLGAYSRLYSRVLPSLRGEGSWLARSSNT
jgi:glycosyltransferase involved in cell wall biosynthesis